VVDRHVAGDPVGLALLRRLGQLAARLAVGRALDALTRHVEVGAGAGDTWIRLRLRLRLRRRLRLRLTLTLRRRVFPEVGAGAGHTTHEVGREQIVDIIGHTARQAASGGAQEGRLAARRQRALAAWLLLHLDHHWREER